MVNRRTSQKSPSPSVSKLRSKLSRIVSRHQHMKVAFNHLKSQIQIGLLEAEDVFASLAMPLMRLVGLKVGEMAEEGRFSTVVMNTDLLSQRGCRRSGNGSERQGKSLSATEGGDEEDNYTSKATKAAKEFIQKQRMQLIQLVRLLKQIENQVNSSHSDIIQTLADHRASIHKCFQRAMAYVAEIHQAGQNHDTFPITLKLLQATFEHVDAALGSVEGGVEDLMHELAEQMCTPMVEYVRGLKAEMTTGTSLHLLAIVEEMGGALRDGKLELEQARTKVRVAEDRNIEALSRLKKSEERITRMKEYLGFFLEAKKESMEHIMPHKFSGMEEDQAKDERLLWELSKNKRKYRTPESPLGPQDLLSIGSNNYCLKPTWERTPISHRPITGSYLQGLTPHTPCLDSCLPFGSSPSVTMQRVLQRNRITP